jgi:hypothetical protein
MNQRTKPCTYQEDTGKKDQGHALLNGGSAPSEPNKDGLTIMVAATLVVSEDCRTYKTPE